METRVELLIYQRLEPVSSYNMQQGELAPNSWNQWNPWCRSKLLHVMIATKMELGHVLIGKFPLIRLSEIWGLVIKPEHDVLAKNQYMYPTDTIESTTLWISLVI